MADLDFKKSCHENKRQKSDFLLQLLQVFFQIEMSPVMFVLEVKKVDTNSESSGNVDKLLQ